MKRSRLLLTACLLSTLSIAVNAEDWSRYRGNAGDGKSSEQIGDVDWSDGPKVLWKVETPLGFSSFAVADGRAITVVARGSKAFCLALDANNGEELWASPLSGVDYGHAGGNAGAPDNKGGDGPRTTPTIDGDRVYVYDAEMVLHCLDSKSGKSIWHHNVVSQNEGRSIKWFNATSPVISGDSVIVGGGGQGQSFLAFNKNDGKLIWKSGDETITHATPQLATINKTDQVIFFVQSGLVGLDVSDGKELWRAKFPFSVSTAASPVTTGNLVYASAGYGVGAGLFRVNGNAEADEVWFKSNELMNHWSTPLIHDGHLYGIYEFKKYGKAPLQCVELETGEIKWSQRGFGPGNCILVGDKLVVLSDAGEVTIVKASPNGYQEISRAKVVDGKCWSTPAFSNGRIYVRSTKEAACIEL